MHTQLGLEDLKILVENFLPIYVHFFISLLGIFISSFPTLESYLWKYSCLKCGLNILLCLCIERF